MYLLRSKGTYYDPKNLNSIEVANEESVHFVVVRSRPSPPINNHSPLHHLASIEDVFFDLARFGIIFVGSIELLICHLDKSERDIRNVPENENLYLDPPLMEEY